MFVPSRGLPHPHPSVSSLLGPQARPMARGRVWIVEDSPLEAEMARRALATVHSVETFADGATLLERIANGARPDALVLDSQLPALPGIEVCRFVRETLDEMALPILMLTIEGQRSSILEGLAAGANDYLTKPYDVAELLARVGVLVRTSHLHHVQMRRARYVALAAEVGSSLAQGGEYGDLAAKCTAAIARHLDASVAALFTVRYSGVFVEAAAGLAAARVAGSRAVADFAGTIASDGGGRVISPVDASLADELPGARAVVGVPLVLDARVAGVLVAAIARDVEPEELDSLASLAQLVALGLERVRAERERAVLLERELRARAEAEAAARAKDEFLALVSHELRSPLNVILGWSDLLGREGGPADASLRRGLDIIRRNAIAQATLIDDLLDVSRIVSGKLRIETAPMDLVEAVETVVESLRPSATNARIALTTHFECREAPVVADTLRVRQVVANLLTNAIKFTPEGGAIRVHVRLDDGWCELRVEDTGRGIDPAFLPHVFERFHQADRAMRRRHGGLGLGLSIVRHIVELHGGTVVATSAGEGRGATFCVRLPTATATAANDQSTGRSVTPSSPPLDSLEGVDVVYVDDDEDAREFVARALGDLGANVRTAHSVHAALERIAERQPDIVISDVGMPDEDGFVLVRKLRDSGTTVPVIALTAYGQLDDRLKAEGAGFDMHLAKPIAPMHLVTAVARLLSSKARKPAP